MVDPGPEIWSSLPVKSADIGPKSAKHLPVLVQVSAGLAALRQISAGSGQLQPRVSVNLGRVGLEDGVLAHFARGFGHWRGGMQLLPERRPSGANLPSVLIASAREPARRHQGSAMSVVASDAPICFTVRRVARDVVWALRDSLP